VNDEQKMLARELIWNMAGGGLCIGVPSSQHSGCIIVGKDMLVLIANQMNSLVNDKEADHDPGDKEA